MSSALSTSDLAPSAYNLPQSSAPLLVARGCLTRVVSSLADSTVCSVHPNVATLKAVSLFKRGRSGILFFTIHCTKVQFDLKQITGEAFA